MTIPLTHNVSFPSKRTVSVIRFPLFAGSTFYEYKASGTYDEMVKNITLITAYVNVAPTDSFTGMHVITLK